MNATDHITPFITKKRCMDSYVHPETISRLTQNHISIPSDLDLDHANMAKELSVLLTEARKTSRETGYDFRPMDFDGNSISKTDTSACKKIICSFIIRNMTPEELEERTSYTDGEGNTQNEALEWIKAIQNHL